jgi:putative ABC transport system permease protein
MTSLIAVPRDHKSETLLIGRYRTGRNVHQVVKPDSVLRELLATILTVERFDVAGLVVVGFSTLATAALVFMLSLRLRRREITTMDKIGGSRGRVLALVLCEIAGSLLLSGVLAVALTWITGWFAADVMRLIL